MLTHSCIHSLIHTSDRSLAHLFILVYKIMTHLFQNQCFLNMKGHSSRGTPLVSTKKKPTKVVMQTTQMAKKRKVAHCSTKHDVKFCE